jgi:hypothetical protein
MTERNDPSTSRRSRSRKKTATEVKPVAKKKAAAKGAKTTTKKRTTARAPVRTPKAMLGPAMPAETGEPATARGIDGVARRNPGVSAEQRRRMIAEAAYYIAMRHGHGNPDRDWLEAEAQVDAMLLSETSGKPLI